MKGLSILFTFCLWIWIWNSNISAQIDSTKVLSIESITSGVLEALSHKANDQSNWEEFRYLFDSTATMAVVFDVDDGKTKRTFSLEEFIQASGENSSSQSFTEMEIGKVFDEFNGIAQVFQSYEVHMNEYHQRGINSYQLWSDGKRWWISSIIWSGESKSDQIPEVYLKQD